MRFVWQAFKQLNHSLVSQMGKNNLNIKDIDLTDYRIELYRPVYMCGLLSEEKKNGFRGIRC